MRGVSMSRSVVHSLAALAATFAVAGCGGKSQPEPVAAEPAEPATPVEPAPAADAGPPAEPAPDPAQAKADLAAAEQSAYELAQPIFQKHCARCHATGGKRARKKSLSHFDMTSYPFGGHHADEITAEIRKVLAIGGGKATMPMDKPGSVEGSELGLISDWADAFDKAAAGGAHEAGEQH
jgi:mono/diheme cytochrome c family protein